MKIFSFLEVKFSIYLNRRVFVMMSGKKIILVELRIVSAWTVLNSDDDDDDDDDNE